MDDYTKHGYSEHFEKPVGKQKIPRLTTFDVDSFIQEISGNRLSGGAIYSKDKKLKIDLDSGHITYNDGVTETTVI